MVSGKWQIALKNPAAWYASAMVSREIEIDEDTDRRLAEIAAEYDGDLSKAVSAIVHSYEGLEAFADAAEAANSDSLRKLRDAGEADFAAGRVVSWSDLKARHGL